MKRQELEKAYKEIIAQLAYDALNKNPINSNLLEIVGNIQNRIRDLDIMEAMEQIKENQINPYGETLDISEINQQRSIR